MQYTLTTTPENFVTEVAVTRATAYPATGTETASYNSLNQITEASGQAFTWDADGNLLSDGGRNYTWDAENRLIGITYPGQSGKQTAFTYDGLGRRVEIASTPAGGGGTTSISYVWCGLRPCVASNSDGSVARRYYAEGEQVISPAAGLYYGQDQIGSTREVLVMPDDTAQTYDYDSYGSTLNTTGSGPLADFRFAGMFYNTDSGLYLTRTRAYDPATGRWLSRDPLGEATDPAGNLYRYVGGNPTSGADPYGLWRLPDYVSANISIAVPNPWTGSFIGWSGSISLDRYGDVFLSPAGMGVGRSVTGISGSATVAWADYSGTPSRGQLCSLLSANSFTGAAGYFGGVTQSCTPGAGWATGVGFVSPQVGVSYNYSFYGGNIDLRW